DTIGSMNDLAVFYQAKGQYDLAEPLYVKALAAILRVTGEDHSYAAMFMHNLGSVYRDQGQFAKAEPLFAEALAVNRRVLGEEHGATLYLMNKIAWLYQAQGRFTKAEALFVKSLDVHRRILGPENDNTLTSIKDLAGLYEAKGEFAKAEALLREALGRSRNRSRVASPTAANAIVVGLGWNLLQQKKFAEAEPFLRECLANDVTKELGQWKTFNMKSMLGGSLFGQRKFVEAEPLLLDGYEGMAQRVNTIPAPFKIRLTEALERLVRLYDAWGQKEKGEEWRTKLSAHAKAAELLKIKEAKPELVPLPKPE